MHPITSGSLEFNAIIRARPSAVGESITEMITISNYIRAAIRVMNLRSSSGPLSSFAFKSRHTMSEKTKRIPTSSSRNQKEYSTLRDEGIAAYPIYVRTYTV